jgi:hypothetical protein
VRTVIWLILCTGVSFVSCSEMYGLEMRDESDTVDSATVDTGTDTESTTDTPISTETDTNDSVDTNTSVDTESETVQFAVPVITITQSSPVQLDFNETSTVLTGTIVAEAGLKQVTVRYMVDDETVDTASWDEFAAPPVSTNDNQTYALELAVADIEYNTRVVLSATDIVEQQSEDIMIDIYPATPIPVQKFTVQLGAQNHDLGSAACLTSGDVFTASEVANSEAALHSDVVDIFYFYATFKKATLYAPINEILHDDVTGVAVIRDSNWQYLNNTKLGKLSIAPAQFDAIEYCHELPTLPASDIAYDLGEGDVVAFETAENPEIERSAHKGIMKVVELKEGDTGFITLDVKVEP